MKSFRFYHLLVAAGALTAWFTAEELGLVHAWTGYVVAGLIFLRLLLGLTTKTGFEFRRLLPFARGGTGMQHPAISATLALALITCIAGTAGTGILMDKGGTLTGNSIRAHDDEKGMKDHEEREDEAARAPSTMLGLITPARAEDGEREEREEGPLGEVHETLGNLILPLAVAHALYLLLFRFQMARFMAILPRKRT